MATGLNLGDIRSGDSEPVFGVERRVGGLERIDGSSLL